MLRSLALVTVLPLVLAGCALAGGALDSKAFQKDVESIQSLGAEGALLAGDVADGRSLSPFVRVHASELAGDADTLAHNLERASATTEVREKLPEAVRLARGVAGALAELASGPTDPEHARRLERELAEAAHAAERLVAS